MVQLIVFVHTDLLMSPWGSPGGGTADTAETGGGTDWVGGTDCGV